MYLVTTSENDIFTIPQIDRTAERNLQSGDWCIFRNSRLGFEEADFDYLSGAVAWSPVISESEQLCALTELN